MKQYIFNESILTGGKNENLFEIIPYQSDDKDFYFEENPIIDIDVNDFTLNDLLERFLDYFEEVLPNDYLDYIDFGFRYQIEDSIGKVNLCDLNQKVLDKWIEFQILTLCRQYEGFMDDFIYIEKSINDSLDTFKRLKTYTMQIEKIDLNYEIFYKVSLNLRKLKFMRESSKPSFHNEDNELYKGKVN